MQIQEVFSYGTAQLERLETAISSERLGPYYSLAAGDREQAIKLNGIQACRSPFTGSCRRWRLHCAILSIDRSNMPVTSRIGTMPRRCKESILMALHEAERRLARSRRVLRTGRMVAELHLGFWVSLLGPAYAQISGTSTYIEPSRCGLDAKPYIRGCKVFGNSETASPIMNRFWVGI